MKTQSPFILVIYALCILPFSANGFIPEFEVIPKEIEKKSKVDL